MELSFNLLILPLLGGFVFYRRFHATAYWAKRASGQTLIFGAACGGLIFLALARIIVVVIHPVSANSDYWLPRLMWGFPGIGFGTVLLVTIALRSEGLKMPDIPKLAIVCIYFIGLGIISAKVIKQESLTDWLPMSLATLLCATAITIKLSIETDVPIAALTFRVCAFMTIILLTHVDVTYFASNGGIELIKEFWIKLSPYSYSGTAFLAFALAAIAWWPLNLLYPFTAAVRRMHATHSTDALENFLYDAANKSELIQITMGDGKFYIGVLNATPPNPSASNAYLRLLPMVSGYRDSNTKELRFTTYYNRVYDELAGEIDLSTFIKILPVASIASTNRFDPKLYIRFDKAQKLAQRPILRAE